MTRSNKSRGRLERDAYLERRRRVEARRRRNRSAERRAERTVRRYA